MERVRKASALCIVFCMLLAMIPVSASPTAVTYVTDINGWSFTSSKSDSGAYIDRGPDSLGNGSLMMYNNTPNGSEKYGMLVSNAAAAKNGHTYILEFDAKLKNAQLQGAPSRLNATISWASQINLTPGPNSYGWTHFKSSYTAPKDRDLTVRIQINDRVEALWLDNIRLYDVENPSLNLVTNGDFEDGSGTEVPQKEAIEEVVTVEKEDMLAVYNKVTIDGKLDDWASVDAMPVVQKFDIPENEAEAAQIKTDIKFGYDEENLYFAIIVENDPVHVSTSTSSYWNGDSLQFAVADPTSDSPAMVERGAMYIPEKGTVHKTHSEFMIEIDRNDEEKRTIYEVALPWSLDFGADVPDEILFNMIINQNDGNGRSYCMEISPGISKSKDLTTFNSLFMGKGIGDIMYSIAGQKKFCVGDSAKQTLKFINRGTEPKTASVVYEETGFSKTVTVPQGGSVGVDIQCSSNEVGEFPITLRLSCDGEEKTVQKMVKAILDYPKVYPEFKARIDGYVAELKELLLKCEAKGVSPDYEHAKYAVISEGANNIELMKSKNYYDSMEEFDRVFTMEYENIKSSLMSYLKGEATPLDVPDLLVTDKGVWMDGTSFIAPTIFDDGTIEERPVFLGGFGHYETAIAKMPLFAQMGFNLAMSGGEWESREVLSGAAIDHWDYLWYNGKPEVVVTESLDDKVQGRAALKVSRAHQDVSAGITYIRQLVDVEPNTTYHFSVKAKGTDMIKNAIFIQNTRFDSWGARLPFEPSTDWKEYTQTYTTGPDETVMYCNIVFQTEAKDILIDDARLYKDGDTKNLLKNGGFDAEHAKSKYTEEAAELGLIIQQSGIDEWRKLFSEAEQNNMMVDMHMSVLNLPDVIKWSDPAITEVRSGDYLQFPIDHETIVKYHSLWCRVILEVASEYNCPIKMGILNEPGLRSAPHAWYKPRWVEFLKERHGTVENMNAAWGSNYQSFEDVVMSGWKEATPEFYDYRCFNDMLNTEFHQRIADDIHREYPDVPVGTKIMAHIRYDGDDRFFNGADYEQIVNYMDINEHDAWSILNDYRIPMITEIAWYDFQTSLLDAPVANTENHIIKDGKTVMYDERLIDHCGSTIWIGGVHGMGETVNWQWDLREGEGCPWNNGFAANTNFVFRPAETIAMVKAHLDLNRLSKEVTALQKAERKVSMLYSRTDHGYAQDTMRQLMPVYEDIMFAGQKPHFTTESTLSQMHDYDLVVIPNYPNVQKTVLEELDKYLDNGGKVLIVDEAALRFDHYNKPHDEALLKDIYDRAIVGDKVAETIQELGFSEVWLVDTQTGKKVENVEWSCVEYDGKMLLNIMNYDKLNDYTVKVMYNGKEVTDFLELRSMKSMQGTIPANTNQPLLLQFDK